MKLTTIIVLFHLAVFGSAETTRDVSSTSTTTTTRDTTDTRTSSVTRDTVTRDSATGTSTTTRDDYLSNLRTAVTGTTAGDTTGTTGGDDLNLVLRRSSSMDFPSAAPSAAPTFGGNCCICDGKKSYVPVTDMLTYDEHLIAARAMGCDLVSIADGDEQEAVRLVMFALNNLVGASECAFIGLVRPPSLMVDGNLGQFLRHDVSFWDWTDKCESFDFDIFQNWGALPGDILVENTASCIPTIIVPDNGRQPGQWVPTNPYNTGPAVYECCIPDRTEDQCFVELVAPVP